MLEAFVRDVRYTIRALRANPGIATVAILSLALGIGKCGDFQSHQCGDTEASAVIHKS